MEIIKAIILGLVQGITEFLPVSSSGHLLLFKASLDMSEVPVLFDVLLHVATLLVVIGFFYRQIWSILKALLHLVQRTVEGEDEYYLRMTLVIIIGTIVTGLLGLFFESVEVFHTIRSVSVCFLLTGFILISTRFTRASEVQMPKIRDGLLVGFAQGIGTLPGISRSGITISAALWGGIDRKRAGELSFILSIPAIVGALLLSSGDSGALAAQMSTVSVIAGFVAAAVSGFFSLKLLIWLISSGRLYYFSIYLIPLGIIGLVWL